MSQRSLLLAVRDYLKTQRGYSDKECEVGFDGKPLPVWSAPSQNYFVAIHPGRWAGDDMQGTSLNELVDIKITVTVRTGAVPNDRIGPNVLVGPAGASLDEELRAIVALLHFDKGAYPVLNAANTIIGATFSGWLEPLRFIDGGMPTPANPDWFTAISTKSTMDVIGIYQTLSFGRARRVQRSDGQG